jgi:hypothetical protein
MPQTSNPCNRKTAYLPDYDSRSVTWSLLTDDEIASSSDKFRVAIKNRRGAMDRPTKPSGRHAVRLRWIEIIFLAIRESVCPAASFDSFVDLLKDRLSKD